ncbi:Dynamin superfamily [Trema orientale]|uniref:Dynamin superfamily n=1 Tax=Trema orientale TaxID=63057 RepID=A0A2P5F9X1_TREOI|nr:Dynamin superfamily [Trema orientale]
MTKKRMMTRKHYFADSLCLDINKNRSIADALSYEEKFFNDHHIYSGLRCCCGISQLSRKLNQILEQHIRMVLPGLKLELNSEITAVVKELQTYGQVVEANVEKGVILLNILSEYCEDFSAMVDGSSEEISTKELSGGARIHYIFQSVFVKSLEDVDPCGGLSDDDIRMAIQNAAGARNGLFVPEVPFKALVRRQIARLLDPSRQCVRYVYDELMKISRACEVTDLQRFPKLRRCLDEIVVKFLRDRVEPAERMIENLVEMEMDYINSSHPNFLGSSNAAELALQQLRSPQGSGDVEKASMMEKGANSQAVISKSIDNIALSTQGSGPSVNNEKPVSSGGNASTRTWGISSIIGNRLLSVGGLATRVSFGEPDRTPSTIQLRELPSVLRPIEITENETVEILVTKLLLREDLFKELLLEQDNVVLKRKRNQEVFQVLQAAIQMLEEVEFDVSTRRSQSSSEIDTTTGMPSVPRISSRLHSATNR